ncbi:gluconate 2-dehydrogenase subunit 3 family protein [Haloarcula sp. GH36]|uniref:gluconate 2-dehydrogenase subunit 3 family protein n=1 Tax=Haloarcula montana TaxID=3111776 RepID=UPI002D76A5B2|nr:gluconate 2-dehydrogenase subunit 3 family protein [Haloarcula sp. GH36]
MTELTRRDALAALTAAGITVGGGAAALSWAGDDGDGTETDGEPDDSPVGPHERATIRAVAHVVYPSELSGIDGFVDDYLAGRVADDAERAGAIADAVDALDAYTRDWEEKPFTELDRPTQDEMLRAMGVQIAEPDPGGEPRQRVRYYLVNDLLFALYASPTGGKLVGIENPQGYPGGTESYRRPPE